MTRATWIAMPIVLLMTIGHLLDYSAQTLKADEPTVSRPVDVSAVGPAPSGDNEGETQRFFARWRKATLGGIELWNDELIFHDWHIQRHVLTGHCRLLDGDNRRVTWGTYQTCRNELEHIKTQRKLPPMSGRVVIVLHGLGGWGATMDGLCNYLKQHGLTTVKVTYASTRGDINAHAKTLTNIITHLDGVEQIDFVAHSLGNLVIRRYLAGVGPTGENRLADKRIKRFVMLAPPNHGATRADDFANSELFELVLGESAMQLGPKWKEIEQQLATPACEFGIIAGGRGDGKGYSSRLSGDDDFVLSVETTKLDGARDFIVVPVIHPLTMNDPKVQEYTLRFLEQGYFIADDKRHPLPVAPTPSTAEKN